MGGIRTETSRMEHLVADLLLLARLDEGRPWSSDPWTWWPCAPRRSTPPRRWAPSGPSPSQRPEPIEVMGDATSLRQVIDNLLGNVRAHTPPGTTARVTVERDGDGAVITVADNGPGMEPDAGRARLRAVLPVRSRPVAGPRRRRARALHRERHRGRPRGHRVRRRPSRGEGTTFTVHLPTAPPAPPRPTPAPSAADPHPASRRRDRGPPPGRRRPSRRCRRHRPDRSRLDVDSHGTHSWLPSELRSST